MENKSFSRPSFITTMLSIMMFLQFFAWGAWFATLATVLDSAKLGDFIGAAYECIPIAAIFAPLFLGLVADRWFASEKVMGVLMLASGLLMCAIPGAIKQASSTYQELGVGLYATLDVDKKASDAELQSAYDKLQREFANGENSDESKLNKVSAAYKVLSDPENRQKYDTGGRGLVWLILASMLCYMPTLGLGNTISFTHIPSQDQFPKIRVWGTIGWIAAGLLLGIMGWSASYNIFYLAAGSSILLGLFCFLLPNTPPPLKGKPMDLRSLFMVDAFKLLTDWNFLVFAVCSTLICVPLAFYYGMTSTFLSQTGFAEPAATMTIGQMSEIFFMLLIPFFFRRLGVKVMILIGMACWVIRYVLFAYGAPDQITWALLLAVALHGICYDFFFVTGFMYTDKKAPESIRGQAQSLLVFLTQGVGMFFGYRIMAAGNLFGAIPLNFTIGEYGQQVNSAAYVENLSVARGDSPPSGFLESFGEMFSRSLPEGLNTDLLSTTMAQWQNFWAFPAILAAGIMIIFALAFWHKNEPDSDSLEK
jgi:MFS family permease